MALKKDSLYWKAMDIQVNRPMKVAKVELKGYASKEDSDLHKMQQRNKSVTLQGDYFPYVDGLSVSETSNLYKQIKLKDEYFKDAEDV